MDWSPKAAASDDQANGGMEFVNSRVESKHIFSDPNPEGLNELVDTCSNGYWMNYSYQFKEEFPESSQGAEVIESMLYADTRKGAQLKLETLSQEMDRPQRFWPIIS